MMLCALCGNKRCPHASNHFLPCANSNEPGQEGSVYQAQVDGGVTPLAEPTVTVSPGLVSPRLHPVVMLDASNLTPDEINVDGLHALGGGVTYLGKAKRQADGSYYCLANVQGALCRVQIKLTRQ